MKYILMMSGKRQVFHVSHLDPERPGYTYANPRRYREGPGGDGEFVATQGLGDPTEAKIVRGEKNGLPITDGIFPESKEFLLGYWIVDVATPERAYAIAGRISAAPGPGGVPTNVPIEVRQFVESARTDPAPGVIMARKVCSIEPSTKRSRDNEVHSDDEREEGRIEDIPSGRRRIWRPTLPLCEP